MAGIPKYVQIAEVLQHRIAHGDYLSGALPGAPKLMQEFGISYMTTRQAMQKLIDDGTVIRAANGRLEVPGAPGNSPKLRVAYLHPSAISLADKWRNAIAGAACKYGCSYQDIPFRYSEDAVVYETLDQDFDMIFFNISPLHPLLLEKLRRRSDRMISLFNDLTCYGIRCFDGINIEAIGHLVEFLHRRGCRRIDFLTVEPNLNHPSSRQLPWERALIKYGGTREAADFLCRKFGRIALFLNTKQTDSAERAAIFYGHAAAYYPQVRCDLVRYRDERELPRLYADHKLDYDAYFYQNGAPWVVLAPLLKRDKAKTYCLMFNNPEYITHIRELEESPKLDAYIDFDVDRLQDFVAFFLRNRPLLREQSRLLLLLPTKLIENKNHGGLFQKNLFSSQPPRKPTQKEG